MKGIRRYKKIGILTFHRSINNGAFLQSYALCKYINDLYGKKIRCEIIDYDSETSARIYKRKIEELDYKQYMIFRMNQFLYLRKSREKIISNDLKKISDFLVKENYDVIIVGSDEVWRTDGFRGFPNAYWLNYKIGNCKKIAYATSSRARFEKLSNEKIHYIKEAISTFDYIGVRDYATKQLLEDIGCNDRINLNCDPVFLIDFPSHKNFKEKLIKNCKLDKNKKIIAMAIKEERLAKMITKEFGKDYNVISLYYNHSGIEDKLINCSPFTWAEIIKNADFVVTNLFHGTAFAIKYKVPFLSVDYIEEITKSKIKDLLIRVELETCYIEYYWESTDYLRNQVIEKISQLLKNKNINFSKVSFLKEDVKSFEKYIEDTIINVEIQ